MDRARWLSNHLTYGNVMATTALFISLGGASYAAIVLGPNSVGPRQLRDRAVTPRALSFPLVARSITDRTVEDLRMTACNSPHRPGEAVEIVCPNRGKTGLTSPGREVHLTLRAPGQLLVSVITGLDDQGPPTTRAHVAINLILDGRIIASRETILAGGQEQQVPAQELVSLRPGSHSAGVQAEVRYTSYEPGDVLVSPVSLVVIALPG
jgi:hypothetical protein